MISEIILPALGETMDEALLVRWLKEPGDQVEKGEPLFEIETDKATIQVEATAEGVLRDRRAQAGEKVPVGQIVGYLADSMEAPVPEAPEPPGRPAAAGGRVGATPAVAGGGGPGQPGPRGDRVIASPRARRLADQAGIEVAIVGEGSGPKGRIVEADVRRYLTQGAPGPSRGPGDGRSDRVVPLTGARRAVADRMTRSAQEVPQFTLMASADMTLAEETRAGLNERAQAEGRPHVTTTALLVAAAAWALGRHPYVNATLREGQIHLLADVHVGVAVAREEGLIVPVVRNADRKGLTELAEELAELVTRAKAGNLTASQASGSTFTVSNLGMFEVDQFTAIINPPESAILAVGRIERKVIPLEGGDHAVRPILRLTLSCDHRVLDGAVGARFLQDLKAALENPTLMLG